MKKFPSAMVNWMKNWRERGGRITNGHTVQTAGLAPTERMSFEAERKRIAERRKELRGQGSHTATAVIYEDHQKAEFKKLRARDEELMKLLGQAI